MDLIFLESLGPATPSLSSTAIGQGGLSLPVLWLCVGTSGGKKRDSASARELRELPALGSQCREETSPWGGSVWWKVRRGSDGREKRCRGGEKP